VSPCSLFGCGVKNVFKRLWWLRGVAFRRTIPIFTVIFISDAASRGKWTHNLSTTTWAVLSLFSKGSVQPILHLWKSTASTGHKGFQGSRGLVKCLTVARFPPSLNLRNGGGNHTIWPGRIKTKNCGRLFEFFIRPRPNRMSGKIY
jgi:hypothetical protein